MPGRSKSIHLTTNIVIRSNSARKKWQHSRCFFHSVVPSKQDDHTLLRERVQSKSENWVSTAQAGLTGWSELIGIDPPGNQEVNLLAENELYGVGTPRGQQICRAWNVLYEMREIEIHQSCTTVELKIRNDFLPVSVVPHAERFIQCRLNRCTRFDV